MRIAFRVDASHHMATGHVMRCRTLAMVLVQRGADVRFICRLHPGNLIELLRADGFIVTALVEPHDQEQKWSPWVGVASEIDAADTVAALGTWRPDLLVVDQYGLDAEWEKLVRAHVGSLMVIDDLANRLHAAEILLDQNYFDTPAARYRPLVPTGCRLVLGPRYALLRPEYGQHPQRLRVRDGNVRRVLLFVGGADNADLTGRLLRLLSTDRFRSLDLDVVIGLNYRHQSSLIELAMARARTEVHEALPHLAAVSAQADLAIGAGGTTIWERLCMGLPALVMSLAPNQVQVCQALAEAGAINYAGAIDTLDDVMIAAEIEALLLDPARLAAQTLAGQQLVDGLGAARTAEVVMPTPMEGLTLRRARTDDMLTYLTWANDPVVRSSAIQVEPIVLASHRGWFEKRLASAESQLYVLEAHGLAVGQIRFDRHDGAWWIDYSLDALVRGRGWGRRLVQLGLAAAQTGDVDWFRAEVKRHNGASSAVFAALGFEEMSGTDTALRSFRMPAAQVVRSDWI
jgi:UDP-2,4-diacetamido-2,4,6-trideoxy-beta-L-altropyranose hydrolase